MSLFPTRCLALAQLLVLVLAGCTPSSQPVASASAGSDASTAPAIAVSAPPSPSEGDAAVAIASAPASARVIELVATFTHACARRADGTVFCWGQNSSLELGHASTGNAFVDTSTPTVIDGLTGVAQIAVGAYASCARMNDATVRCWGAAFEARPDETKPRAQSATPSALAGITDATQIAVGDGHACVLHRDATVSCWGDNGAGQLGDGTNIGHAKPKQIAGLTGVVEIGARMLYTCARLEDATERCWGFNYIASLGDGSHEARNRPTRVKGLTDVAQLGPVGEGWNCSLQRDGHVMCWGDELQTPDRVNKHPIPIRYPGIEDVVEIVGDGNAMCMRERAGTVRCFGGSFVDSGRAGEFPMAVANVNAPFLLPGVARARGIAARAHKEVLVLDESGAILTFTAAGHAFVGPTTLRLP